MLFWLLACEVEDAGDTVVQGDTEPVVESTDTAAVQDTGPCAGAMTVTWNSWGRGFLTEACQGCHHSEATQRYGAPDDIVFDTVDDAWTHADRILARAAADDPTMPPAGGVTEDDRTRLVWWLTCGEPGS